MVAALWLALLPRAAEADASHGDGRAARSAAGPLAPVAVTLARALALAVKESPELAPARADSRGAARLEGESRGFLTHPAELSVAVGPRFYGDATGVDASVTLLQPLPLGGAGASRERTAAARTESARAALGATRAKVALAAGEAWVAARVAAELVLMRAASVREAELLDALAEARLGSGSITAGERALASAVLGAARGGLLEAEGRRFVAHAELALQTGLSVQRVEAVGPVDEDGPDIAESEALARALHHAELEHRKAEARVLEQSVAQLRAEGAPALSIGPSVTREATGDVIVLGHFAAPLPFFNPNEFEAAERERQTLVARAELARAGSRLRTDALLAHHERSHSRALRDHLARHAVAPARAALDDATLRYREGKAPLGEVLAARRALHEVEERWLEAAGAARLSELHLLWVTGRLTRGGS